MDFVVGIGGWLGGGEGRVGVEVIVRNKYEVIV